MLSELCQQKDLQIMFGCLKTFQWNFVRPFLGYFSTLFNFFCIIRLEFLLHRLSCVIAHMNLQLVPYKFNKLFRTCTKLTVYLTNYIFPGSILTRWSQETESNLRRHVLDFFKEIQFRKDGFKIIAQSDITRIPFSVWNFIRSGTLFIRSQQLYIFIYNSV